MYLTPDSTWRIFYHAHISAFCIFVFGSLKLFNEFSKSEAATQRSYPSLRLLLQRFILKHGFFKIFVDLSRNDKRTRFFQILTLVLVISRITDNESIANKLSLHELRRKRIIPQIRNGIWLIMLLLHDVFQHCFAISYRRENQRSYELKAATESDCKTWIEAIREAR